MAKTAGIVVIGNEILSGKVQDVNAAYLARELRLLGVDVQKISVITDDVEIIAAEVSAFSRQFDLVFTSGGVGPTHDDVTIEGIARGFGRRVIRHPELEHLLRSRYGGNLNEARLKLTEVPEGATLASEEGIWFPAVTIENVYIFPGIPDLLRQKFELIKERFRDQPYFLRKVYVKENEGNIAAWLHELLHELPDLLLGSYPDMHNPHYKVMLTLESKDEGYVQAALDRLLALLPQGSIHQVD
ncbi:MAG: competence/damage-inducible protein A [Nitrospinae bacterium]|nr:competence/damage-inducible protein A [Nitrospinota bacterium]